MRDPAAVPFCVPVPETVKDYFEKVANPIDLCTILKKLRRGERQAGGGYADIREYAEQVRLVFDNARTFYGAANPVYIDAGGLLVP